MKINPSKLLVTLIASQLAFTHFSALAKKEDTYLASDRPFAMITNVNDEVLAWATCSATLTIISELIEGENPNAALQMNNLSNGADASILMSQVSRVIAKEDFDIAELNATISYCKLQMTEAPKAQQAIILSDLELLGAEVMMEKLNTTLEQCIKNNETQKMYVDMWRDMVRTGIFQ